MKNVFSPIFIKGNEVIFYAYLICMLIIMIATVIFIIRELKKK
jgi:hypothetical protein